MASKFYHVVAAQRVMLAAVTTMTSPTYAAQMTMLKRT